MGRRCGRQHLAESRYGAGARAHCPTTLPGALMSGGTTVVESRKIIMEEVAKTRCAVARCIEARDLDTGSLGRSKEIEMRMLIHDNPRRLRFAPRASLYAAVLLGGALF